MTLGKKEFDNTWSVLLPRKSRCWPLIWTSMDEPVYFEVHKAVAKLVHHGRRLCLRGCSKDSQLKSVEIFVATFAFDSQSDVWNTTVWVNFTFFSYFDCSPRLVTFLEYNKIRFDK